MKEVRKKKKTKKTSLIFYFVAATTISTALVLVTILEGNRIKRENELLSYEVW